MRSVCLESLGAPWDGGAGGGGGGGGGSGTDRQRAPRREPDYSEGDSYSSASLSEVEEWDTFSEASSTGEGQAPGRHQALQHRIDACQAAIYRHRMTIEMLQYGFEQDSEADPGVVERSNFAPPPEVLHAVASGDEGLMGQQPGQQPGQQVGTARRMGGQVAPAVVQDCTARLVRRCLEGLGSEKFQAARRCLQASLDAAEVPANVRMRMVDLLGLEKIGFLSLIDQLVHMERRRGAQDPG